MTADEQKRRSTSHFGIPSHSWATAIGRSAPCLRQFANEASVVLDGPHPSAEPVTAQGSSQPPRPPTAGRAAELLGS